MPRSLAGVFQYSRLAVRRHACPLLGRRAPRALRRRARPAEADAKPIPELAKKDRTAPATIYARRKHFGGLAPTDVKPLSQLEQEHGRLKKLVADLTLDIDVLKAIFRKPMVSARVRREQVAFVQTRGLSAVRAPLEWSGRRNTRVLDGDQCLVRIFLGEVRLRRRPYRVPALTLRGAPPCFSCPVHVSRLPAISRSTVRKRFRLVRRWPPQTLGRASGLHPLSAGSRRNGRIRA